MASLASKLFLGQVILIAEVAVDFVAVLVELLTAALFFAVVKDN